MTAKDDRKNAEGYNDPTAYNAIKNVEQEQDKDDMRFHQLLWQRRGTKLWSRWRNLLKL